MSADSAPRRSTTPSSGLTPALVLALPRKCDDSQMAAVRPREVRSSSGGPAGDVEHFMGREDVDVPQRRRGRETPAKFIRALTRLRVVLGEMAQNREARALGARIENAIHRFARRDADPINNAHRAQGEG